MTLAIKLAIIAALILSIFIPFGYFFIGEETKNVINVVLVLTHFSSWDACAIASDDDACRTDPVQAADAGAAAGSLATGLGYLAAALIYRTFLCWWWYRRSKCCKCCSWCNQ